MRTDAGADCPGAEAEGTRPGSRTQYTDSAVRLPPAGKGGVEPRFHPGAERYNVYERTRGGSAGPGWPGRAFLPQSRRAMKSLQSVNVAFGLLLILALAPLTACDLSFIDSEDPQSVTVEVSGTSESGMVRIVTSTVFRQAEGDEGQPSLLDADTSVVQMPHQRTHDLGEDARFFVEAASPDSTQATLTMRVVIEGEERFDATRTVTTDVLRFSFVASSFGT